MFRFPPGVCAQSQFADPLFDAFHQLLNQGTLHSGPIRNFINHGLAVLPQKFLRGANGLFLTLGYIKNIYDRCPAPSPQLGSLPVLTGDKNPQPWIPFRRP